MQTAAPRETGLANVGDKMEVERRRRQSIGCHFFWKWRDDSLQYIDQMIALPSPFSLCLKIFYSQPHHSKNFEFKKVIIVSPSIESMLNCMISVLWGFFYAICFGTPSSSLIYKGIFSSRWHLHWSSFAGRNINKQIICRCWQLTFLLAQPPSILTSITFVVSFPQLFLLLFMRIDWVVFGVVSFIFAMCYLAYWPCEVFGYFRRPVSRLL